MRQMTRRHSRCDVTRSEWYQSLIAASWIPRNVFCTQLMRLLINLFSCAFPTSETTFKEGTKGRRKSVLLFLKVYDATTSLPYLSERFHWATWTLHWSVRTRHLQGCGWCSSAPCCSEQLGLLQDLMLISWSTACRALPLTSRSTNIQGIWRMAR